MAFNDIETIGPSTKSIMVSQGEPTMSRQLTVINNTQLPTSNGDTYTYLKHLGSLVDLDQLDEDKVFSVILKILVIKMYFTYCFYLISHIIESNFFIRYILLF